MQKRLLMINVVSILKIENIVLTVKVVIVHVYSRVWINDPMVQQGGGAGEGELEGRGGRGV